MVRDEIRNGEDIPFKYAKSLISSQPNDTEINFFGGEPTLYPHFVDLLSYALDSGHSCSISTNGKLFASEKYAEKIARLGVARIKIQTSIYGHTAEIHEFLTNCPGSFYDTCKGISNMLKYQLAVLVNVVITRQNVHYLCHIVDLLMRIGVKRMKFAMLVQAEKAIPYTPIIVLKGAALAETVYQNKALRPMGDVDLLVKKEDLHKAEITLLNLGYAVPERYKKWCYEEHHHLPPYVKGNKGIAIEVHWTLERPSSPFQIEIDGMWERARAAKIANVKVLVLSPEDLILHLCLHVSKKHNFRRGLKRTCDISETIKHYQDEIDWKQLISTANEYGISKFIYCILSLAKKMLGTEIPGDVLNELKPDNFDEQLLRIIQDYIISQPPLRLPSVLSQAIETDGCQNKMKILFRSVFPSLEKLRGIYSLEPGSAKPYFYYFVRLFDLLIRHSKVMLQLAFQTKSAKLSLDSERYRAIIRRWLKDKQ